MTDRSLPMPHEINNDPDAIELVSVWLSQEEVHVTLLLDLWKEVDLQLTDEREAWGHILSLIAQHVAHGMAQSRGWETRETLAKLKKAFLENVEHHERMSSGGYLN
jgi:hypothetical protein